jgi:hypothetical protein
MASARYKRTEQIPGSVRALGHDSPGVLLGTRGREVLALRSRHRGAQKSKASSMNRLLWGSCDLLQALDRLVQAVLVAQARCS